MSARHENLLGLKLPTETKWRWVKVLLGGNISLGGYRDSKSQVSGVSGYSRQIPTTWHDPHRSKNVIPYLGAMGPSHLLLFHCISCYWFYSKLGWFQAVIVPNPKSTRHHPPLQYQWNRWALGVWLRARMCVRHPVMFRNSLIKEGCVDGQ